MLTRLGLKDLSNDSALNIEGLPAHTGFAPINTSFGRRLARFTTIYYNDRAYVLAVVAKDKITAGEYDRQFLETAGSFHALTPDEMALAKPLKINVITADNQTRYRDLAHMSPLKSYPEEQLRLLNGMAEGEPQAGMLLKIVE